MDLSGVTFTKKSGTWHAVLPLGVALFGCRTWAERHPRSFRPGDRIIRAYHACGKSKAEALAALKRELHKRPGLLRTADTVRRSQEAAKEFKQFTYLRLARETLRVSARLCEPVSLDMIDEIDRKLAELDLMMI